MSCKVSLFLLGLFLAVVVIEESAGNVQFRKFYLQSTGFDAGQYLKGQTETWIVQKNGLSVRIKMTFETFDVDGVYPECKTDNLIIKYSGASEKLCGNLIQGDIRFYPFGDLETITIVFDTTKSVQQKRGFKILVEQLET